MNSLFLNNIKGITERLLGYLIDGNDNRQQVIDTLNKLFNDLYILQLTDRRCIFSVTKGNKSFHNTSSSFQYRSGIEMKILNDISISNQEIDLLLFPILGDESVKRLFNTMGFDTLRVLLTSQNKYFDFDLFTSIRSTISHSSNVNNRPNYKTIISPSDTTKYISSYQPPKQQLDNNTEYKRGDSLYYKKKK